MTHWLFSPRPQSPILEVRQLHALHLRKYFPFHRKRPEPRQPQLRKTRWQQSWTPHSWDHRVPRTVAFNFSLSAAGLQHPFLTEGQCPRGHLLSHLTSNDPGESRQNDLPFLHFPGRKGGKNRSLTMWKQCLELILFLD